MHIFMLETRRGSEDGFVVRRFHKHHRYDVADTLARAFIAAGWAEYCNSNIKMDSRFRGNDNVV